MDMKEIEKAIKDGKSLDNINRRSDKKFKIDGMDVSPSKMPTIRTPKNKKFDVDGEEFELQERPVSGKMKLLSKGGSVSKRADGCAQRGKTRGKMV
jgi:hypothetical protein